MKPLLPAAVALILAVSSCEPQPRSEDAGFESIPAAGWPYDHSLEFIPQLGDSAGVTRVAIAVRHNNDYEYSNLWLELTSPLPGTDSVRIDTIDVEMADIYGHWYGRGAAMSYILVDTLPDKYYFENNRPMSLRHIMRTDTVTDITQVGLIFMYEQAED